MLVRYLQVDEIPDRSVAPVYGSREWLQCFSRTVPMELVVIGAELDSQIVGWLPVLRVRRWRWTRALPLYVDTTGGPYFNIPKDWNFTKQARLARLIQEKLLQFVATEFDFALLCPLISDPRALPSTGQWQTTVRSTARLDLDLENPPWGDRARRSLRKAQNKKLMLKPCQNSVGLEQAVSFVQERHQLGKSVLAPSVWIEWWKALQEQHLVETWAVTNEQGDELAYGVVALDEANQTVRFWYNLNTPQAHKLYASDFLFYALTQVYKGRYRWFDFCGTDTANLLEFKEKWASENVFTFAYDLARHSWMRHALRWFSRFR